MKMYKNRRTQEKLAKKQEKPRWWQEKTAKMPGDFDLDKREKCGINIADGNHAPICDLPKYSDCAGGLFPHKRFRV